MFSEGCICIGGFSYGYDCCCWCCRGCTILQHMTQKSSHSRSSHQFRTRPKDSLSFLILDTFLVFDYQTLEVQHESAVVAHESWQEAAEDMSGIINAVEECLNQTIVTPSDVQELQTKMQCLQVKSFLFCWSKTYLEIGWGSSRFRVMSFQSLHSKQIVTFLHVFIEFYWNRF